MLIVTIVAALKTHLFDVVVALVVAFVAQFAAGVELGVVAPDRSRRYLHHRIPITLLDIQVLGVVGAPLVLLMGDVTLFDWLFLVVVCLLVAFFVVLNSCTSCNTRH